MASEGMKLPPQQQQQEKYPVFDPAEYEERQRQASGKGRGGGDSGSRRTDTDNSGSSGWWDFFFEYVLWVLVAGIISAAIIWLSLSHGTWPWYLSAEVSSALTGILGTASWIRHDRAKARTSTEGGKGGLDQLGFFNSRLAKRNLTLFRIATKEVVGDEHGKPSPPAAALVAKYWEAKGGSDKTTGHDNDDELMKILQPEYAIGMQIITRDDYTAEMNEYFAQSELSLGLIVPLILVVLGLVLTPQIGLKGVGWVVMCSALMPICGLLFFIGMERWQKYRMELKLLILGNWERLQAAKQQAKPTNGGGAGSSKPVQDAIAKAIQATSEGKGNVKVDINIKA